MLNLKIDLKFKLIFLLLASITALSGAYISQYVFGLLPCPLCLYQRIPFFLVIFLTLLAIFAVKEEKSQKNILKIALLALIFNGFLAAYHVGVEQGLFVFDKCADDISNALTLEELKQQILQKVAVRCDEPQFILFGLSMAAWNVIYCFGLVLATIFAPKILNYKKK